MGANKVCPISATRTIANAKVIRPFPFLTRVHSLVPPTRYDRVVKLEW